MLNELKRRIKRLGNRLCLASGVYKDARVLSARCGFFGNLFMTLNGLRMCEAYGVPARPVWGSACLFHDEREGADAWAYFFKPVKTLAGESREKGRSYGFVPDPGEIWPLYPGLDARRSYADCIHRFVQPRDDIRQLIEESSSILDGSELGVHMRFTDANPAFEGRNYHPVTEYFSAVDKHLDFDESRRIFVATDSEPALDQFIRRYGSRVLYLNNLRSRNDTSIHGHYDQGVPGSPRQKGVEVLLDAYLLSRTRHLIRCHSRVSAFSLCLNPDLGFTEIRRPDESKRLQWL